MFKAPKFNAPKIHRTKVGERTLTSAQKRKLKESRGFRCDICGREFNPRYLEIHHKKGIAEHRKEAGFQMDTITMGKKHKPSYDNPENLQVVCLECHDTTKKKPKKQSLFPQYKDMF